jgi:hypothetical protein
VLARVEELQQALDERLAFEALETAANEELARRNPGVQVEGGVAGNNNQGDAPRRPFLPAPEKWDGEISAEDPEHASLGLNGRVWMQTFDYYVEEYNFDPLLVFNHFLTGKARIWYHHYTQNIDARDEELDWDEVREEFIRQYSPADRRTQPEIARAKLHKGDYAMTNWGSYTQFEQAFRNLIRDCPDMAVADQIHWFITGLSPYFRKACATQQDGTPWTELGALTRFAQGVEVRDLASRRDLKPSASVPKRKTLTLAPASVTPPSQILPGKKSRPAPTNSAPKRAKAAGDERLSAIPYRLRPLFIAAEQNKWRAPDGGLYTPETFMAVAKGKPPRCLQCHKTWGTGGECKGHDRADEAGPSRRKGGPGGGARP